MGLDDYGSELHDHIDYDFDQVYLVGEKRIKGSGISFHHAPLDPKVRALIAGKLRENLSVVESMGCVQRVCGFHCSPSCLSTPWFRITNQI